MSTPLPLVEPVVWTFDNRRLTVLGTQGDVEYAKGNHNQMWYRFIRKPFNQPADPPDVRDSWKLVAR